MSLTTAYLTGMRSVPTPRRRTPAGQRPDHPDRGRARPQPPGRHGRGPARHHDRRNRRLGLGQVQPHQPDARAGPRRAPPQRDRRAAAVPRGARAGRTSTRSSPSTSRPSGARRAGTPATYTGLFGLVRDLFARLPESIIRGYKPGRFSFNVKGGRCETCKGAGIMKLEMTFLPDVYVACETCKGRRYNAETLGVRYKGKNIAEVLDMPIAEAVAFFEAVPRMARILRTLDAVGLGYLAPRAAGDDALGRRGAARQARPRALAPRHGPDALHPRRAHDGPPLRGRPPPARRPAGARRPRQHGLGHRAQHGRRQAGGLDPGHGPGRRRRRRAPPLRRPARGHRGLADGAVPA